MEGSIYLYLEEKKFYERLSRILKDGWVERVFPADLLCDLLTPPLLVPLPYSNHFPFFYLFI